MEFFGMGWGEILFIMDIALVIWGPGKIVDIGRNLGKITRTLKKATTDLTTQVTREIDAEERDKKPPSEKT